MNELIPIQKQTLEFFGKSLLKDKFYWTGGTLLSFFHLHHRHSTDIDFFSDSAFSYEQIIPFIRELKKELKLSKIEEKRIFDRYEFFVHNKNKLRIEFVLYEYPKLSPRKKWKGINLDSLDDIATNKMMALFDRSDPKDLYDLYFLMTKKKYSLQKLLKMVEKKFGVEFSESIFWSESHKAAKDLSDLKPLVSDKKTIEQAKEYFIANSNKYLNKVLK